MSEMEDAYYEVAEDPDQQELADWILNHLVDVHLNPRAPMILEIWSKSGKLKLRKKKKK